MGETRKKRTYLGRVWMPRMPREYRGSVKAHIVFAYLCVTRFMISVSQVADYHIGDHVWYGGNEWWIANANKYNRDGERLYTLRNTWEVYEPEFATAAEIKKVRTIKNCMHSAMSWFNWYWTSWINLDLYAVMDGKPLSSVRILGKRRAHGGR